MSIFGKYSGLVHLLAVVVLLPLLAWRLALADTAGKWFDARRTEREVAAMHEKSSTPMLSASSLTPAEHIRDGELLGDILCGPGYCEVVRYAPYASGTVEGLTLHTAEIVLSTDFLSAVRIVDNIERTMPASRIRSVMLRSLTPRGAEQPQLHATLVVQQITTSK